MGLLGMAVIWDGLGGFEEFGFTGEALEAASFGAGEGEGRVVEEESGGLGRSWLLVVVDEAFEAGEVDEVVDESVVVVGVDEVAGDDEVEVGVEDREHVAFGALSQVFDHFGGEGLTTILF